MSKHKIEVEVGLLNPLPILEVQALGVGVTIILHHDAVGYQFEVGLSYAFGIVGWIWEWNK